jgi:hypothetical protein
MVMIAVFLCSLICRTELGDLTLIEIFLAAKATENIVQSMSSDTRRVPLEWVKESPSHDDESAASQDSRDKTATRGAEMPAQAEGFIQSPVRGLLCWCVA